MKVTMAVLLVLACGWAWGTAYYVDPGTGNDGNAGTSEAAPWKTLGRASGQGLVAGDSVLLRRGAVLHGSLYVQGSGTAAAPVTVTGYGVGADPVIDGSGTGQYLLVVLGQSYVVVRGVTVTAGVYPVVLYNASHVTLEGLTVRDATGYAGIFVAAAAPGLAEYNVVRGCQVYGMTGSADALAYGNNGCGIYLYGAGVKYSRVEGCTVHDVGHEGIPILSGSANVVTGNTVYRTGQSGIRVALEESRANVLENNVVYQCCQAMDDRCGIDLIRVGNDNVVRYNVVHDQRDTLNDTTVPTDPFNQGNRYGSGGIRFDGGNWAGGDYMNSTGNKAYYNVVANEVNGVEVFNFSNVSVLNNAVWNCKKYAVSVQSVGSVVCSGTVVKNNAVFSEGAGLVYHNRMTGSVIDRNVYWPNTGRSFMWSGQSANFSRWKQWSRQDARSKATDPLFTNPQGGNFMPVASSPCVQAGTNVGLVRDMVGVRVPLGSGVDVGAYEVR